MRMSMAFLSDMLKCRHLAPGEELVSTLPRDAQVLRVLEMPEDILRGGGVLTLLVESDEFGPCKNGEVPPEFVPTFTRRKLVGKRRAT